MRTINGTKTAGINRVNWDLRGEQTKEVVCAPARHTHRKLATVLRAGASLPRAVGCLLLMPPGTYTVKLSAAGVGVRVSRLMVIKDPNSEGTEADINTQMAMLFELRKDLESAADMVNQIELIRSQLGTITALLNTGTRLCPHLTCNDQESSR